jgi:hypothetical protein
MEADGIYRAKARQRVSWRLFHRLRSARRLTRYIGDPEDVDEDNMEEIDLDNIVGSRTRGKNIDYAQAAKELEDDDEDDEEDDDFEDPDDKMMED